jgi:hypothetical protein
MDEPKTLTINVSDSITLLEAIKLRKFEDGFMVGETISRDKIAGKTKQRAHELLTIDRSDPNLTVKYHYVQEYDPAGQPVGVPHEHLRAFPAKRRPPRP